VATWNELKDTYVASQDDEAGVASDIADIEEIIGYSFTCKKLLHQALTKSCKSNNDPDYQRLEFLGDAVLDLVVAAESWIDQGCELRRLKLKTQLSVDNMAPQAVCFEAGLYRYIRGCDRGLINHSARIKADFDTAKQFYQIKITGGRRKGARHSGTSWRVSLGPPFLTPVFGFQLLEMSS